MTSVAFHFHGYQPGDIVCLLEPDPLEPPRFEERRSPVAHAFGAERIAGRNWTDAVLHAYGRIESVLERVGGATSVDIEPQTLVWLLERDSDAHRRVLAAYEHGTAGFALTPPFHPILPHHHRLEREALFDLMVDFYAPLLRRTKPASIGLWLPEAAYSAETMTSYLESARRAAVDYGDLPDLVHNAHLLLDRRQISPATDGWAKTASVGGLRFAGRDPVLSGGFAFGASEVSEFCEAVSRQGSESILIASDLESLLANPAQAERFETIVASLRDRGMNVSSPAPSETPRTAEIVDYSSWSDYDEHLVHGHTSDTRWTALRRSDGLVVSRVHRGRPMSQLWKHAFTLTTERIETAVRRTTRQILRGLEVKHPQTVVRRLAVAYGRHLFRHHYRTCGMSSSDTDFSMAATEILRGKVDVDLGGYLARGYTMMLMGLRSDPRFWDNPDTRVTFQNVAFLAQSLVDTAHACQLAGMDLRDRALLRLLQATLLEFAESYERGGFAELQGVEGWETTETAWHEALQSEVSERSGYDVFRRATLFAVGDTVRAKLPGVPFHASEVVADTGHIVGETHGDWENKDWCEHRPA